MLIISTIAIRHEGKRYPAGQLLDLPEHLAQPRLRTKMFRTPTAEELASAQPAPEAPVPPGATAATDDASAAASGAAATPKGRSSKKNRQ